MKSVESGVILVATNGVAYSIRVVIVLIETYGKLAEYGLMRLSANQLDALRCPRGSNPLLSAINTIERNSYKHNRFF